MFPLPAQTFRQLPCRSLKVRTALSTTTLLVAGSHVHRNSSRTIQTIRTTRSASVPDPGATVDATRADGARQTATHSVSHSMLTYRKHTTTWVTLYHRICLKLGMYLSLTAVCSRWPPSTSRPARFTAFARRRDSVTVTLQHPPQVWDTHLVGGPEPLNALMMLLLQMPWSRWPKRNLSTRTVFLNQRWGWTKLVLLVKIVVPATSKQARRSKYFQTARYYY